jgi:branched-chain amino acid transport system substrate-binding protein
MPTAPQAAIYSAIRHYLRAIEAAGTDGASAVMAKMREMPVNDFYTKNGRVREDGRLVHDMYFVQVKTPAESKSARDYYKVLATIPGNEAFRPLNESGCPLIKQNEWRPRRLIGKVSNGSRMAQHEPVARIGALCRKE